MTIVGLPTSLVMSEVAAERVRQDIKWGEQNHPDGTGGGRSAAAAAGARMACKVAARDGSMTWRDVMREEVAEAFAETDPAKLRAELLQVAAVAAAWVEAIDRRPAPVTSTCCDGTGFADYAAVPCPDPKCPVPPMGGAR
jgi:hypothetical protein